MLHTQFNYHTLPVTPFNLKINLIFSLFPEKCIKFNQLEWRIQNPEQPISSLVMVAQQEMFFFAGTQ